jgi:hypothetical protein
MRRLFSEKCLQIQLLFASVAGTAVLMCSGHLERAFPEHKKKRTTIPRGYQIYHTYIRPHEALNGKTPSEACGIKVEGENKWLTLIQNASKRREEI